MINERRLMTETAVENEQAEQVQAPSSAVSDEQFVAMVVDRARNEGLQLTGNGGLLQQLTKRVLEFAQEGEITDHVGYEKHDLAGKTITRPCIMAGTSACGMLTQTPAHRAAATMQAPSADQSA
jgi:hypothetical protein